MEYTLSFADAAHHYISVRGLFPAPANTDVQLSLPVWTPGSYLVREYARNIEDLRAASPDGAELTATKSRKNRWSVRTGATPGLVIEYRIYSRELSVRTNFVDADHAIINGAPTFLRLVDDTSRPQRVRLDLPEGWQEAHSGLERIERNHFEAHSYDELIDSPILAGAQLTAQRAEVYGVPEEELGQFYAQRTLLKREVLPEHVAAAVLALTGPDLSLTTGLHIPVDSGVAAAFLR